MRKKIYYICESLILAGTILLSFFRYKLPLDRLWFALNFDFASALKYYLVFLFTGRRVGTSVTDLPKVDLSAFVTIDAAEMLRKLREMWPFLFDWENFCAYCIKVLDLLYDLSIILMFLIPILLISYALFKRMILKETTENQGEQSKATKRFRRWVENPCRRVLREIRCFVAFSWEQSWFKIPFLILWAAHLNLITIVVEVLAFYFYFCMAFDFAALPIQLVKLLIDVLVMLDGAPWIFWTVASWLILDAFRKHIGYKRLEKKTNKICAFLEKQPLVLMLTGTMGSKKTTALAAFTILDEIRMRKEALELMHECNSLYPNFPWINLELALQEAFRCRHIFTLTSCRDWVALMQRRFNAAPGSETLFGYDLNAYALERDDGLWVHNIWKTIEEYACLYLIYTIETSLIASNVSIRTDGTLESIGNFPLWKQDLFKIKPRKAMKQTCRSHILDYDTVRLGKRMGEFDSSFEFGVMGIPEIGKERGNTVTQQEIKKSSEICNQKNDLFNWFLKVCRHPSTVRHTPFIRIITDDQRPESWGADARDLASILHIRESSGKICVMPFFFLADLVYILLCKPYAKLFDEYRYDRGDVALPIYLLHNVVSAFRRYRDRIYNVFGVYKLEIETERGTMDGEKEISYIELSSKLVHSERFATDSHRGYTDKLGRSSRRGLNDYPCYEDTTATLEELRLQNSHFVTEMEKLSDPDKI